jgi:serine/threonine protein kinase
MTEPPGPSVAGYELRQRVSRDDGPTEVWQGAAADGGLVALKLLVPRRASPDQILRFHQEGELLEWLGRQDGVVPLLRRVTDPPALVFAWAAGGSLRDVIHPRGFGARAEPLPAAAVRRIGLDLCAALGRLHDRGVYHRDVKPANVLLAENGRAVLADFGIAARGDPPRSLPGGWIEQDIGTLGYAAPELLRDPSAAGPGLDIYALGVTLYEALTCRLPHDMSATDTERTFRWRLTRGAPPIALGARGWNGPAALGAAIEKAIASDPSARHQTMEAFRVEMATPGG